jgi:hypothetical protein
VTGCGARDLARSVDLEEMVCDLPEDVPERKRRDLFDDPGDHVSTVLRVPAGQLAAGGTVAFRRLLRGALHLHATPRVQAPSAPGSASESYRSSHASQVPQARYFKAGLEDQPVPCITVQASRSVLPLPAIGRNRATRRRRRIPLVGMDVALVLRFLATAEHPAHALPRPWTPLLVELQRRALRRAQRQLLRPGPTSPPYVARYTSDWICRGVVRSPLA